MASFAAAQVLGCLAAFYKLPWDRPTEVHSASAWIADGTSPEPRAAAAAAPMAADSAAAVSADTAAAQQNPSSTAAAPLHEETSTGLAPADGAQQSAVL